MAKIKINERQASLIKSLTPEKKIVKITKEQYNRIFADKLITESDDVTGGNQRVNKNFKKTFSSVDVQNLSEDEFDIKKPNTEIPKLDKRIMNRPEMNENESNSELHSAVTKLIHDIYNNPTQAGQDPFWESKGLTFDDIEKYLCNIGLLISTDDKKYIIAKKYKDLAFTSPVDAIQAIETQLKYLIEKKGVKNEPKQLETEDSGYPAGAQDDPSAPYNQIDSEISPKVTSVPKLNVVAMNKEIAILKDDAGVLYVFYYYDIDKNKFGEYADRTRKYVGKDETGEPDFEYSDNYEIDANTINHFVNDNLKTLTKGEGFDAFEQGINLVKIDDALRADLVSVYDKDKGITKVLGSIEEEEKPNINNVVKDKLASSLPVTDTKIKKTPEQIKKALADLRTKELNNRKSSEVEETTSAGGSSGAFTGPLNAPIIKKELPITGEVPIIGEETIEEVTVAGSAATGGSSGPYDANALPGIGRNGEFKTSKKSKAEVKTQYPNGGFVKIDSCTQPNNNKSAQNGKCSQGAVDSVVKVKQSKGSIISPSLSENVNEDIIKEVAGKTGKSIEEVKRIIESKIKAN